MTDEERQGYAIGLHVSAGMADAMVAGIGLMFNSETVPPEARALRMLAELLRAQAAEAAHG